MWILGLLAAALIAWFVWRDPSVQRVLSRGLRLAEWRPAIAVVVVMAVVGALALALRGAWVAGAVLAAVALWAGLFVRRVSVRRTPDAPRMGRSEAASLLGVSEDASPEEVRGAYRRLMQRAHPDTGGTQGLAAQLNAAREVLLARRDR